MSNYNQIKNFYRKRYSSSNKSHKAVGWESEQKQYKRFKALIKNFDQELLKKESIVDFGCGLADLLPWLQKRSLAEKYIGVDIMEEFLKDNRKKFPEFRFIDTGSFLKKPQKYGFIVASGVFTLSWGQNHRKQIKDMIKRLYNKSYHGFSFNMISSFYPKTKKNYYYFNPLKMGEFCTSITERLIIDCSYLPEDFTITLFKNS
ncbi:class I SAM-dependent methyltransferase [Acetohalobium arabaticum]|uniref:Methyltransferase type 12 n=1 Tax=Acetohalobium arabaticum (strain ATCC 49924 / DSM 5501 / Z-7288) TaxID=574087 RepID=D9QSM3_ACEAZ|nr:class I SAM-dependent methyltransferase [Acetohalobium arabaticum]ADL13486.1 hypothetical protein Acear_1989 [Acetohalobium arabaticum DSM 5501]